MWEKEKEENFLSSQTCHHKQYSKILINNNELTEIKIKKTIFFVIFEYN